MDCTQKVNKRKLSQIFISWGCCWWWGGHSWLQCNPPLQESFTPLGLRKSLGILRKVLEASRVDSHLKLKGPQRKHTVKILESASILPAESKLTKSQLSSQWVGPGGTGNGSNNWSSGLDIGEVCLGDRHQPVCGPWARSLSFCPGPVGGKIGGLVGWRKSSPSFKQRSIFSSIKICLRTEL